MAANCTHLLYARHEIDQVRQRHSQSSQNLVDAITTRVRVVFQVRTEVYLGLLTERAQTRTCINSFQLAVHVRGLLTTFRIECHVFRIPKEILVMPLVLVYKVRRWDLRPD